MMNTPSARWKAREAAVEAGLPKGFYLYAIAGRRWNAAGNRMREWVVDNADGYCVAVADTKAEAVTEAFVTFVAYTPWFA